MISELGSSEAKINSEVEIERSEDCQVRIERSEDYVISVGSSVAKIVKKRSSEAMINELVESSEAKIVKR